MHHSYKIFVSLLLLTTSCFKFGVKTSAIRTEGGVTSIITEMKSTLSSGGGVSAAMNINSTTNQLLMADEGSAIKGTNALFPPGSLGINTSITIEESATLATAGLTSELDLGTEISQSGTAISIQPETPMDAKAPFTLSLPLPLQAGLTAANMSNLVVIYRVSVQAEKKVMSGVIPLSEIVLKDGVAQISTLYFGSFQTAITTIAVTDKIQAESKATILTKAASESLPPLSVISRSPFIGKANGTFELNGVNFRQTMIVAVAGKKVSDLKVQSDSKATFILPATTGYGLANVTIEQDGVQQAVSVLYTGASNDFPVSSKPEAEVCLGEKYYDASGILRVGARSCSAPVVCTVEGQVNCTATLDFPTVAKSTLAPKIIVGQSVAGVSGTAVVVASFTVANCAAEGAVGCVTTSAFPAIDKNVTLSSSNRSKIRSSLVIVGLNGTMDDCAADGQAGCVVIGPSFAAAATIGAPAKIIVGQTLAGISGAAASRPADCSSDGALSCVTTSAFPAVDKTNNLNAISLAKIHSSVSIAGIAGTMQNCASDGATGCLAVTGFAAANAAGSSPKILLGHTVGGITGSASLVPLNCSTDNEVNCVATVAFPAVVKANVTPGVIKNGFVVAGVSGNYPSPTFPLVGSTATADLTTATFNAQVKSATAFEYFSSSGVLQTGTGDVDITNINIKNGIDIFGSTGSYGTNCSVDGQTNCLTTSMFKAMDSSLITSWDIRIGKTAGGVAGVLDFYRNMANIPTFDRSTGTSALVGLDVYDTIDDHNNVGTFPIQNPPGFNGATGQAWVRDQVSDSGTGGGVASNGICDGTEQCVYQDKITNLYWARSDATTRTWEAAITYCEGITFGSYTNWRLPTEKEIMQAYIDGIWSRSAATQLGLSINEYWTSTSVSVYTPNVWTTRLQFGGVTDYSKTNAYWTLCVR